MNKNGKDCEKVKEEMSGYLDGRLSSHERLLVKEHLSECRSCQRDFRAIQDSWNLLSSVPQAELPAGFEARFWAKARREESADSLFETIFAWPKWARAAVGVAGVTAVWLLGLAGGLKSIDLQRVPDQSALRILTASQPPNSIEEAYMRGPLSEKRNSL
jgi:anti-sigma factor RsiW